MVGDTYTLFSPTTVGAGSYLEVKPAAGQEIIIHNIYHEADVEVRLVDGSGNALSFLEESGKNVFTNVYFHLTETQYLRIYNASGGAQWLAVDGIISLE